MDNNEYKNIQTLITNCIGLVTLSKVDSLICIYLSSLEAARHKAYPYDKEKADKSYKELANSWVYLLNLRTYLLKTKFHVCTKTTALKLYNN